MKSSPKSMRWRTISMLAAPVALLFAAMPALAQENAPDITDMPLGLFFRWLNFALIVGGLVYFSIKVFGPYFRKRAGVISGDIRQAAEDQAAAQRQLEQAERQLAGVKAEIEGLKRAAAQETADERERIRELGRSESERVARAALAEIEAAERAGRQELRAIAARLATERAAALLRKQMNPQLQSMIFRSFISQLPRSAQ